MVNSNWEGPKKRAVLYEFDHVAKGVGKHKIKNVPGHMIHCSLKHLIIIGVMGTLVEAQEHISLMVWPRTYLHGQDGGLYLNSTTRIEQKHPSDNKIEQFATSSTPPARLTVAQ